MFNSMFLFFFFFFEAVNKLSLEGGGKTVKFSNKEDVHTIYMSLYINHGELMAVTICLRPLVSSTHLLLC